MKYANLLLLLLTYFCCSSVNSWNHNHFWSINKHDVPHDHKQYLTVALKQRNLGELNKVFKEVSRPTSKNYGKYLSIEEIADLISPPLDVISKVSTYFESIGGKVDLTLSRDFLVVMISVGSLENALNVKFHRYENKISKRQIVRTLDWYEFPPEIGTHIDVVTGVNDFADFAHERRFSPTKHSSYSSHYNLKKNGCASSAPNFGPRINGQSFDVSPTLTLYCKDGSSTSTPSSPCSDHPPTISTITLSIQPSPTAQYERIEKTININDMSCSAGPDNSTRCIFPSVIVPSFSRLSLSAFSSYSDGSQSDVENYPTLFSPSPYVFPSTIYKYYNVPTGLRATHPQNSQAVTAFELQYINVDEDLYRFFDYMGMPHDDPTIVGQNDPTNPGGESTLDIQYIMGVGAGVPTYFYSVTGPGPAIPPGQGAYILEWALIISNTTSPPLVTSISYGDTEDGYFNKFGNFSYIDRMNVELQKMAVRGLTVLAGSGDAGASNVGEAGNDISPTDPTCSPFRPFFPSNSPYVLSVSSSFLSTNSLPICSMKMSQQSIICEEIGEVACGVSQGLFWTTGGGFSNMSSNPRAPWQSDEIAEYISILTEKGLLPPSQFWNSDGRGYPDVSTIGHNCLMVLGREITPVDGTSASGPIMAGLISLLNDARLNAGKKPLGFVNEFFYAASRQNKNSFRDIVVGNNYDGDVQPRCSPYPTFCSSGFTSTPGWDAVTGLGTPNFKVLVELALQLP